MAGKTLNDLSWKLVAEWRKKNENSNILFSPLSIASAFLLVYKGGNGKTKKELETLFGFKDDGVVKALDSKAEQFSGDSIAVMANRVYVEQTIRLQQRYVKQLGPMCLETVDFKMKSNECQQLINSWVSEVTRGLIPDIIPPGILDGLTRLMIVNALYFKGNWQQAFLREMTRDDTFYGVNGVETVPFMKSERRLVYKNLPELDGSIFCLPYNGNRFKMYIFLPNQRDGWKTAEEKFLTQGHALFKPDNFKQCQRINLKMPKWKMEMTFDGLKSILETLGVSDAFSTTRANFSGITPEKDVYISDVVLRSKVIVDEVGTEAAAAAFVSIRCCSGFIDERKPLEVVVNHPFFYFVVDVSDDIVLFHGTQTSIA